MIVAGVSAFFHDSACCLMRDGELVAAAQEERFTRVKYEPRLPVESWRHCLAEAGIHPGQVDAVAYYEIPEDREARRRTMGLGPSHEHPVAAIRERLGFDGEIVCHRHHASHAAAAFLVSPFREAAVLTVDAVGEWDTTSWWHGDGTDLHRLGAITFPHSLGLLYSTVTSWLGFAVNGGEGKVMGLAAHGEPRLTDQVRRLVRDACPDRFALDLEFFDFGGRRMFSPRLVRLFGPPRTPSSPITRMHADVAASLQSVTEELLLSQAHRLYELTGSSRLCLGGGVALNCLANGRIARESPFEQVWVQPAAGDAGSAVGAAALEHVRRTGERPQPLEHVHLGPSFDAAEHLAPTPLSPIDYRGREADLLTDVVQRLADGQVIGWFCGRMELGPRALGARSILADPRREAMRDRVNGQIKRREPFRPFAPSLLTEDLRACFGSVAPSPFMTFAHPVTTDAFPAATHVDGTARLHTVEPTTAPRFAALLARWRDHTGCPALLDTSFNGRGEPIVCTPSDALKTAVATGLDAVVIDDWVIDHFPARWRDLYRLPPPRPEQERNLYTF